MGAPLPPGPGHLTTCSLVAPTVVPIPGYLLSFDWPFLLSRLVSFPNSLLHVSGPAMALRGHVPVLPGWSFHEATPGPLVTLCGHFRLIPLFVRLLTPLTPTNKLSEERVVPGGKVDTR